MNRPDFASSGSDATLLHAASFVSSAPLSDGVELMANYGCEVCGGPLVVSHEMAGKPARCGHCGAIFVVAANDDQAIASQVRQKLRTSAYRDIRAVECACDGGIVHLHGRVQSFYHKQLVQSLVGRIPGVQAICNGLFVVG